MAIANSGINVSSVDESDISIGRVYIKANSGGAVVKIDGHEIAIDDEQCYQQFNIGNRSFEVVSGSIDFFTEV